MLARGAQIGEGGLKNTQKWPPTPCDIKKWVNRVTRPYNKVLPYKFWCQLDL